VLCTVSFFSYGILPGARIGSFILEHLSGILRDRADDHLSPIHIPLFLLLLAAVYYMPFFPHTSFELIQQSGGFELERIFLCLVSTLAYI